MNDEDSEQIEALLAKIGFSPAASPLEAQVIVLNTCSVRKKPEDKAFSMLGALVEWKASRPNTVLGVCGCMAQIRADEIRRRAPHVDFVLGTGDLGRLPSMVAEVLETRRFVKRLELPERRGAKVDDVPRREPPRTPKLKAFVPIQYGCDKFCTFCIVPSTRGRERSRAVGDIVEEATRLAELGTKEITLLGQTVNSYGKNLPDERVSFADLLWRLADVPGIERIRYTSPYPRDFKGNLIAAIRDCPAVMEHVHLPLQSGHDDVLKAMHRVYTLDGYLRIVEDLRRAVPHIAITTDVIVAFPGETEEQFEKTLEVMREVRYDGAFMFAYSPRPGTPTADMPQQSPTVKKERMRRVSELQNAISCAKNEAWVGELLEVLVEGPSPKNPRLLQGYSREFKMVHFPGHPNLTGKIVKVRAKAAHLWGLSGDEPIS